MNMREQHPDTEFDLSIDGQGVPTKDKAAILNPANGALVAMAPICTADDLDRAVAAANKAFATWGRTAVEERRRLLRACAEVLRAHKEELARVTTLEQGKPLDTSRAEVARGADWLDECAAMEMPHDSFVLDDGRSADVMWVPLGSVCAITAWNTPITLFARKVGPALIAGNTVVVKPSPFTPLGTLRIGALLRGVLPPGVLNVLNGNEDLGARMTEHPGFAKTTFTGSSATGRHVMRSSAANLTRLTLELGGNDAAIVMPDVDVDAVAPQLFTSAFFNSGQVCVATKRLFVHEAVFEPMLQALTRLAKATRVGDGLDPATQLGPIQNRRQFERVNALLDDCRRQGFDLVEGQAVPSVGYFVPVVLVVDPPDDSRVVREEAFGPVLPILRFADADEAVRRANRSEYGLAGSVWCADETLAVSIASRLETATVWVNHSLRLDSHVPFGSRKNSGTGIQYGLDGLKEYMAPRAIHRLPAPRSMEGAR